MKFIYFALAFACNVLCANAQTIHQSTNFDHISIATDEGKDAMSIAPDQGDAATGTVPDCVTNMLPASGSTLTTETTATLTWQASPGATLYDVYFDVGSTTPTGIVSTTTALSYSPQVLKAGTTYSWMVVPRNASGANTSCATVSTFSTAPLGHVPGVSNAGPDVSITLPDNSVFLDGTSSAGSIVQYYWYQVQGPVQTTFNDHFSVINRAYGLTTAGKYIFGLQVKDNNGALTYSFKTVTVNVALPGCVANLLPASGTAIATKTTATLTWQAAIGATLYDVYLGEGVNTPTGLASTTANLSYSPQGLTAGKTYSWMVVPRNAGGANINCTNNIATFTTAPLGNLTGGSNAGSDAIINLPQSSVSLDASASTGNIVQYYWYQVQGPVQTTIANPLLPISTANGLTTTGKYIFGLQAKDDNGVLTYSYKTVTVNPACVINISPANGSTLATETTATLTWQASPGASSYDIYFGENGSIGLVGGTTGLSYILESLTAGRTYTWAVVPKNANGANTACKNNSATFTMAPLGHVPGVSNAGPDETITLPTSTIWLDASASTGSIVQYYWYEVQGPVQVSIANPVLPLLTVDGLTIPGKYIFGLQVKDNNGAITNSYKTVTVNPAIPVCVSYISPASGSTVATQTTATLSWQASPGASSYDIYFGENGSIGLVGGTTGLSYSLESLTAGRTYIWAVVPKNISGANTACTNNTATFTMAPLGHVPGVSNAGPDVTITLPTSSLWLDASASTGSIVQYYWYQVQGPVKATIVNPVLPLVSADGLTTPGKYIFGLQVKDNNGALTYSYKTVTVNAATTARMMDALPDATSASISKAAGNSSLPSISAEISPNPIISGKQAILQINSSKAGRAVVNIVNSNGAIVGTKKLNLVAGINTSTVSIAGLAQGFHVISITGAAKPLNLKLIIQ